MTADVDCTLATTKIQLIYGPHHAAGDFSMSESRTTDAQRGNSLHYTEHGRKLTPNPKFLSMTEAYFVCHIGPNFQISMLYAFIACP